jgi:hypothetical protein
MAWPPTYGNQAVAIIESLSEFTSLSSSTQQVQQSNIPLGIDIEGDSCVEGFNRRRNLMHVGTESTGGRRQRQ